jgi:hypothetical protein
MSVCLLDEMDGVSSAWHAVWLAALLEQAIHFVGGSLNPVFAVGLNYVPVTRCWCEGQQRVE